MRLLTPPARLTPIQWADEYRVLSPEGSAKPGRFRSSSAPYQIEPTNSVVDSSIHTVVLMWASQTGKTEGMNNIVCFFIDAEPSSILMVQPTVEFGEAWSKERFDPMIRDTPRLRDKVRDPRSRDSGNTIMRKTFPGGNIAIVGANAPSGLAGRPRRVVLLDEVDRYPPSAKEEGDPCALAIRRTESFWNAIVVMTSTPTVKGASRIEQEFEETDQRRWFVNCPVCNHEQTLQWSQVQWDEGKPETARYVCAGCNAQLDDKQRIEMVKLGRWKATAPFKGKAGFHLNGIASLFRHKNGFKNRLHQMAADFLSAKKKGKEAMKTWVNTFLAETYGEEREKVDMKGLINQRETYVKLPVGALLLTAGVDVQGDRFEVTVYAWGVREECWGVCHRVIPGRYDTPQPWEAIDALLDESFEREDGLKLKVARMAVDSSAFTDHVYKETKRRFARGVVAVKGSSTAGQPVLGQPSRANKHKAVKYQLGVDTAKGIIMDRLRIAEPGPGFYHFTDHRPAGFDEEFFAQLTAEEMEIKKTRGFVKRVWVKTRPRNEALDIAVYALAALYQLNPNWSKLAENLKPSEEFIATPRRVAARPGVEVSGDQPTVPGARTYELRPVLRQTPVAEAEHQPEQPAQAAPERPAVRRIRRISAGGWVKRW